MSVYRRYTAQLPTCVQRTDRKPESNKSQSWDQILNDLVSAVNGSTLIILHWKCTKLQQHCPHGEWGEFVARGSENETSDWELCLDVGQFLPY